MSCRNNWAISGALAVVFVAEKWAILVNRSTTTRMESLPEGEGGRATMKSIETEDHAHVEIGSGARKPCGLCLGALARAQASHVDT